MKRCIFVGLMGFAIVFVGQGASAEGGSPDWVPELQSFLGQAADVFEVPGAAAVVVVRGRSPVVFTHGVRCAGEEGPITSRDSFGVASLTKAFTAASAASQVADGVVDWDTPAQKVIPEVRFADGEVANRITLRDLLAHRSGLGSHDIVSFNVDADPAWMIPRVSKLEMAADFRDHFSYSGLGYVLAGEMLARADDTTWEEVVKSRILQPLGMSMTTVGPPQNEEVATVCGHLRSKGEVRSLEPVDLSVSAPGNGLYSTAEDLGRWLQFLLSEGEIDGRQVVDGSVFSEMWTPQIVRRSRNPSMRAYGLGWHISQWRGRQMLSHDGGGAGFTSAMYVLPKEGVAIAVLANVAVNALPDAFGERARELVLGKEVSADLLDRGKAMADRIDAYRSNAAIAVRAEKDGDSPPDLSLDQYAGCFENEVFGRFEVGLRGGRLVARFHGVDLEVEHLRESVFLFSGDYTGDQRVVFSTAEGVVSSLTVSLGSPSLERRFTPCH